MLTRRSLLTKGALIAGAGGAGALFPGPIQKALAIAPDPGTTYLNAEHVVVLMQENRSFDHLLGTLRGVRGFADRRTVRQGDGTSVFIQREGDGAAYLPWRADLKDSRVTWLGSTPHARSDQLDAWNGGVHNNWVHAKRSSRHPDIPLTLGYHTREDIPFYHSLADAFTVCDQYFASGLTETSPNRLFMWSGNLREPHAEGSLPYLKNAATHPGALAWTCFPERLEKAGVSWRVYQNDSWCESPERQEPAYRWLGNAGDNTLERFLAVKPKFSDEYRAYASGLIEGFRERLQARKAELEIELTAAPDGAAGEAIRRWIGAYDAQLRRLDQKAAHGSADWSALTEVERSIRSKVFTSNREDPLFGAMETVTYPTAGGEETITLPKGDIFYQFRKDVREGNLPTVSWLVTPANFSAHPSIPFYGAWYVSELIDILTETPEVWKKTIFILTFDENDGFFDHVPPFVACDPDRPETGNVSDGLDARPEYAYKEEERLLGTPEALVRNGPIGLGYRVPTIIASPWSRGGWVNSQVFEHSSIIQFLEHFVSEKFGKDVRQDEISTWRRAISGDLTSCFRAFDGTVENLPFMDRNASVADIERARGKPLPNGFEAVPVAEYRGTAAERALLDSRLWQETGLKPSCALPYELSAQGQVSGDGAFFDIELAAGNKQFGSRAAGAPFILFLHGVREGSQMYDVPGIPSSIWVANYAVKAGDVLSDRIALDRFVSDRFDIEIFGPNGFYRNFVGTRHQPALAITCSPAVEDKSGPRLEFSITNPGAEDVGLEISSNAYAAWRQRMTVGPGKTATATFSVDPKAPWYDLSVKVDGGDFRYQAAGRLETGNHSVSDPAMGMAGA